MTLLVRDLMTIGVPICRLAEACGAVATRLAALGRRGEVVVALDSDGMACGWASRDTLQAAQADAQVQTVLEEHIPEVPPNIPAAAAVALLHDRGLEYAFLMHNWPGEPRPSAVFGRRAAEERLAQLK